MEGRPDGSWVFGEKKFSILKIAILVFANELNKW